MDWMRGPQTREILKRYGLDPHISKISLHEEKLEDILLRIIKERKGHAE